MSSILLYLKFCNMISLNLELTDLVRLPSQKVLWSYLPLGVSTIDVSLWLLCRLRDPNSSSQSLDSKYFTH